MRKVSLSYIILSAIAFSALIGAIVIPEIGTLTLWNEVFAILIMLPIIVILIKALITLFRSRKILNILLVLTVVLVVGGVTCSKSINIIKDVTSGPKRITISDCEIERRGTSNGIFSLNYYLMGEDSNGKSYRFRISGKEYECFQEVKEVSVLCYRNTGRIIRFEKGSEIYE